MQNRHFHEAPPKSSYQGGFSAMVQSRNLSRPTTLRSIWLLPLLLMGGLFLLEYDKAGATIPYSNGSGGGGPIAVDISGKVTDSTGAPVVGALVKLLLAPGPAKARVMAQEGQEEGQAYQETTDQNGYYEISEVPAGLYQMQVDAPGQLPWGTDLDLREGGAVVQDSQLWPPEGQVVVFQSDATDLIPGDADDEYMDIYLAHARGGIEKLSNTPQGQNGGDSFLSVMSDSNRFIVFESKGRLVPEDQNDTCDVYRFDRATGTLTCLTTVPGFPQEVEYYTTPFTSGDGRFTVFSWRPDAAQTRRIFMHDSQTGEFTQVSVGLTEDGVPDGDCGRPVISAFGRYIAFESWATNLVPDQGPDEKHRNIFVHDRLTRTTVRALDAPDGSSQWPSISADGTMLFFRSEATNLLADPSPRDMIYVRDLVAKSTAMVSVDNEGNPAADSCYWPAISGNGRYVSFSTGAALVPEDTNDEWDVYIRDLQEGTTTLVSQNATGTNGGNNASYSTVLGFDGTYALFVSEASDLLADGAPSMHRQVYIRDLLNGLNTLVSRTPAKTPGNGPSITRL
jgi:Tol biopolymer transport system component